MGPASLGRRPHGARTEATLDQDQLRSDRPCTARPTLAASLACFRDGQVLIARRGRPPSRGLWSLPGGRVELGERAAEAAMRELQEETGVRAQVIGLADVVEVILPEAEGAVARHVAILAYAGHWISGEATPGEEATEVAWVRPEALSDYETTPGLALVIERARSLCGE
ncbi:NUDIX hydrolase [Hansschlegelia sp. KR7-227]|uniref:NUDIX hydrolase n=1 Tax=Hansschlegelia sp. KR7-227 TaxID=3400914 RepID=UPI003C09B278